MRLRSCSAVTRCSVMKHIWEPGSQKRRALVLTDPLKAEARAVARRTSSCWRMLVGAANVAASHWASDVGDGDLGLGLGRTRGAALRLKGCCNGFAPVGCGCCTVGCGRACAVGEGILRRSTAGGGLGLRHWGSIGELTSHSNVWCSPPQCQQLPAGQSFLSCPGSRHLGHSRLLRTNAALAPISKLWNHLQRLGRCDLPQMLHPPRGIRAGAEDAPAGSDT